MIGSELVNTEGDVITIDNILREKCDDEVDYVGACGVLVHNAECRVIDNGDGTYDVEMSYKKNWSQRQKNEAKLKCKRLSEANTTKTKAYKRNGTKTSRYRKDNSLTSNQDVDHILDLQLGGKDEFTNMWGLDKSVNRSLGSQISFAMRNLLDGTVIRNFIIK